MSFINERSNIMVCCWDCGMRFKSREKDGEIEVYDTDKRLWTDECPNCGSMGFEDGDYDKDGDYEYA